MNGITLRHISDTLLGVLESFSGFFDFCNHGIFMPIVLVSIISDIKLHNEISSIKVTSKYRRRQILNQIQFGFLIQVTNTAVPGINILQNLNYFNYNALQIQNSLLHSQRENNVLAKPKEYLYNFVFTITTSNCEIIKQPAKINTLHV